MTTPLSPCPACRRHVRVSEPTCPFCAASIEGIPIPPRARPRVRLGRAALFAFGTAALAPGCYDHHLRDGEVPRPVPAVDAAFDEDAGGTVLLYGTPPEPDPVAEDAGVDAGSTVAAYGAPAFVPDAGEGGPSADYGGPPAD